MNRITVVSQTGRTMKCTIAILMTLVSCLLVVWAGPASAEEQTPQPLSLTECILVALQNNPEIVSSQLGIVGVASRGISAPGGSDWRNELGLGLSMTLWRSGRSANVAESRVELKVAALTTTRFWHPRNWKRSLTLA